MEKTVIEVGSDYMDFVAKFDKMIRGQNIMLVYEGEVSQDITKAFTSMAERSIEEEDSAKTQKRVYHVMVECLQNVCKHADSEKGESRGKNGRGIFIVTVGKDKYFVTTGNVITNDKVDVVTKMMDKFNGLSHDEVKAEYKRMIKESRLSEKAGAGLGLIDIIKKTSNKIEYHFEKIDEEVSFFIQKSSINRE